MYFDGDDLHCEGDYYIQTKNYYEFWEPNNDIGKRTYWDLNDVTFDCSNVMFSEAFTESLGDRSFSTEL